METGLFNFAQKMRLQQKVWSIVLAAGDGVRLKPLCDSGLAMVKATRSRDAATVELTPCSLALSFLVSCALSGKKWSSAALVSPGMVAGEGRR